MPAYAYTGLNSKGRQIRGVASADNVGALKNNLKREGVFLTAVTETAASALAQGRTRDVDFSKLLDRVTPKMVAQMTRLLATLLAAGVTLPEALTALTEQVESQRFRGILADVGEKVNQGSALADALAGYPKAFPQLYVNMVRAGESSGALETVLLRLAEFLDRQLELQSKITSAMFYPIVLTFLAVGIVAVLMVGIVPKITTMFEDMSAELPWNTRLLIFSSHFTADYWYVIVAMAVGVVWAFRRWKATERGTLILHRTTLRVPVIGDLARKIAIARFSRTLSTLLASGVRLLDALAIVQTLLGNVVLEKVVASARDNIREGEGIAPALRRSGEFPPLVTHMVAVGERSGQLEQMLNDVAEAYERETNTAIGRMTTLIEPLMIVGMGLAVAFVMFSIMQPIMMLNEMAGG